MKKYNTPHRRRVIKTRLTEEEYAEFSERVTLCKPSRPRTGANAGGSSADRKSKSITLLSAR